MSSLNISNYHMKILLPLWVGLTQDQTLPFRASYKKQLIMQCCQVTCIVCEQVLALFPGSSPAFCCILYKTVCDKKLGRSLGTSSRYCSCHYMQSVVPAGAGLSGHCPGISAHYMYISRDLSKRTARAHVYHVHKRDMARGHGLWRSRVNLESIEARSIHSHLCLPRLLLVFAGASACNVNLVGLRCSCKAITSCCFMTVNEYVNKAGFSCKLV